MNHEQKVLDKINRSTERTQERSQLWKEICAAYEEGGVEQVESFLAEKAEDLKNRFEEIIKKSKFKPQFMNTWGDAIYFVFDDPVSAAECALELKDYVTNTEWEQHSLPADLNIRIGLHVGPVFGAKEPLLNRMNYFGRHVNWAARIEPITNPGNVYASEQFASMLMTRSDHELEVRYVGIIVLPKKFGTYPIYLVKRKNEFQ